MTLPYYHIKLSLDLKTTLLISIILFIVSCQTNQNQMFDKTVWNEKDDLNTYPNRNEMLSDLIKNHQLKGLTYKQLVDSLGMPENYSDDEPNTVYYNIVTDFGHDIDPVYTKDLKVSLNSDSIVTGFKIIEIKH